MVRKHLPLDNRKFYNIARKALGLQPKGNGYCDLASWNTNFIDNIKNRTDVQLTVISAHSGLKRNVVYFTAENVSYFFVRCEIATLLSYIIKSPAIWHKLNPMRPVVQKIVRDINPDIVALMGAENAYISGTVLGLEKSYPVIFKAQTIYNNPDRPKFGIVDPNNAYVEKLIFDNIKYASVSTKMHYDLYRKFNQTSFNFRWRFGTTYPIEYNPHIKKEYDFVNFALHMIPAKGYTDAIQALQIVRQKYPDVKLNLIGNPSPEDKQLYLDLVSKNELENNVIFTPAFEKQSDLFEHIQKSRYAVLPYKLDYIASTTYQSMYYKLPVICYKTLGTPKLNNRKECVLLAEMQDINSLANCMIKLLDNEEYSRQISVNAKELVDLQNDPISIANEIIDSFTAIINNYRYGKEIPTELIDIPQ